MMVADYMVHLIGKYKFRSYICQLKNEESIFKHDFWYSKHY